MNPVPLERRADREPPRVFRRGTRPPFAIRWYGATSLWGHFRNFVSTAIARESVDARDWMRPLTPHEMLDGALEVLGHENRGTLLQSLGRPIWIDWVADTGDDRDVSQAVGRMIFSEYAAEGSGDEPPLTLPRGDILLFGGDTAYPVATSDEIHRRLVEPWNEVLDALDDPRPTPRLLLGIPGNHDWYDGLDGFGRLFRSRARHLPRPARREQERKSEGERNGASPIAEPAPPTSDDDAWEEGARPSILPSLPGPVPAAGAGETAVPGSNLGRIVRGLHLDEVGGAIDTALGVVRTTRALWEGETIDHRRRLGLRGYVSVQESTYWALPLAPGLDLWGVDRQLGRLDYRQRGYFGARRASLGARPRVWLVAPDPALAFGERWELGERILEGADLSLERDRVLYQCGDMHQYERRDLGGSMHVIAGGGGAFLHGTRIVEDPRPAAAAYPSATISRRLALTVPLQLMLGRAGYLVHIVAALVASLELAVGWSSPRRFAIVSVPVSMVIAFVLYLIAGHRRAEPRRVLALAIPFGFALGQLPVGIAALLDWFAEVVPIVGRQAVMLVVHAHVAALLFGVFLALCALGGLEMQQVFTVLGHPGFKHFVRMRVSPDGTVDAWAIGKDDPLGADGPWLVDRWTWR